MPGLSPGNQTDRPTGRMILYHLSGPRLRVGHATEPPTIVISRGVQLHPDYRRVTPRGAFRSATSTPANQGT